MNDGDQAVRHPPRDPQCSPRRAGLRHPRRTGDSKTPQTHDTASVSTEARVVAVARDRCRVAADLIALTKPRVVLMILVTTVVGYYVGLIGTPDYVRLVHLLIGTMLAAGGTLALNQYWERDVDARMERTRGRPLPDGRLSPLEALVFAAAVTIAGLGYLGAFVGS